MYQSLFDYCDQEREIQLREPDAVTLRPYQEEAVASVFSEWEGGSAATLVCMPTGTGKSVVFSEVMRRWSEQ